MLDLFALLLLFSAAYKAKPVLTRGEINTDYLSQYTSKMLKGLFAIVVIFSHLAVKCENSILFNWFGYVGYLAVAFFLFISGYGLMKNLAEKPSYLDTYVRKRLFSVVIPFLIILLVYWLASFIVNTPYSVKGVLISLLNGYPIADNSWYMITCIIYYFVFYLFAKMFNKNSKAIILATLVFSVIWIYACIKIGYPQWWYLSTTAFVIGMIWARSELSVVDFFKNHYLSIMLPLSLFFCVSVFTTYQFESSAYKVICASIFVVFVFAVSMKIKLRSPILRFLGSISLEIYLIHGLFVRYFRSIISSDFIYVTAVLAASIVSAIFLHLLFDKIKRVGLKRTALT